MKEAKDTITMERVTLEINNQGQWQVTSAERWPLLGGILRMTIAGLLAISAVLTAITVLVMSWAVVASGAAITDNNDDKIVGNIFIPLTLMLMCIIVVLAGITVAKGVDAICHRECFVLTYAMVLGLSPVLMAIYAVNFIGPMNDVVLFLKIMLMKINLEHFLYGAFAFIWENGFTVMLALAYSRLCIQKPAEADHEETESETETEVEG